MFNNIDGVIFDLDGTLIDSMGIWLQIDIEFLSKRGLDVPLDIGKMTEGKSFTENAHLFKKTFNLNETVEEIKAEWIEMAIEQYSEKIPFKSGAIKLLKELKNSGIKVGIGTSCSRDLTEAVIQQHKVADSFYTIVTSCEVCKGKPFPDVFLKVAEVLEVPYDRVLVFEDTIAGVQAAKAAGMKVVAVYDRHSEKDQKALKQLADYYIESMEDIKNIKQIEG